MNEINDEKRFAIAVSVLIEKDGERVEDKAPV
jgi:hypothetical protein